MSLLRKYKLFIMALVLACATVFMVVDSAEASRGRARSVSRTTSRTTTRTTTHRTTRRLHTLPRRRTVVVRSGTRYYVVDGVYYQEVIESGRVVYVVVSF